MTGCKEQVCNELQTRPWSCNAFTEERQKKTRFTIQAGQVSKKERNNTSEQTGNRGKDRQALKVVVCGVGGRLTGYQAGQVEQGLWVEETDWIGSGRESWMREHCRTQMPSPRPIGDGWV